MNQKQFIEKKLEEFYKLYEDERKNNNAPITYIDFFKARFFLSTAIKEANENMWEEIKMEKIKIFQTADHNCERDCPYRECDCYGYNGSIREIESKYNSFKE